MDEEIKAALRLLQLKEHDGWKYIQGIIDDRVADAESLWLGSNSTDPLVLVGVQRTARATKAFAQAITNEFVWAEQRLREHAELTKEQQQDGIGYGQ